MFNIILDKLPNEFKGYLIRTDFRIGIQILLCMKDVDLNEYEKTATALNLLYGNSRPPFDVAMEGLKWFMLCGKKEQKQQISDKEAFCFQQDNHLLYTAFLKNYNIDLKSTKLHWFEFMYLIQDLNDCAFVNIIDIRLKDLSKLKGAERAAYSKMQQRYMLEKKYSYEEKMKIAEFEAALRGEEIVWQDTMEV